MVVGFLEWVIRVSEAYHGASPGWLWPVGLTIALIAAGASALRYTSAEDKAEPGLRLFFAVLAAVLFAAAMAGPRAYGVVNAAAAGTAVAIGLLLIMIGVGSVLGDRAAARRRMKAL